MDTPRKRGKPFEPSNRFGRGRPAGSRNKATLALQELLEGEGEAITRKAIDLAKEGDMTAIRVCLERLIPPCRERRLKVDLPDIATAQDIDLAIRTVIGEVAQGKITISEAERLANVLEFGRKSIETKDLERRMSELEKEIQEYRERRAA